MLRLLSFILLYYSFALFSSYRLCIWAGLVDSGQLGGDGFKICLIFYSQPVKKGGKAAGTGFGGF
jgi:hypothetical protein